MKTLKFRTNINCGGCIAKVTPFLNEVRNILKWEVDTSNPMKILTVETDILCEEDIISILLKAGYKAETLSE